MWKQIGLAGLAGLLLACGPSAPNPNLKSTLEAVQEDPAVNYSRGIVLMKKQEFSAAAGYLNRACQADPENAAYWNGYGLALFRMGELEGAEAAFQKTVALQPLMTDVYNNLGMVYTEMGKYDEALAAYGKVLQDKTYTTPFFPYFNIGLLKLKQGKEEEAMLAFEHAVQLKPDFYRAYAELATIYYRRGMIADAYNAVKKAQKQYPNEAGLLLLEAQCQFRLGRIRDAERVLTKLGLLYPKKEIREQMDALKKKIRSRKAQGD